jgi:hypothetical protein
MHKIYTFEVKNFFIGHNFCRKRRTTKLGLQGSIRYMCSSPKLWDLCAHARSYEIYMLMPEIMRSMCSCPKLWDLCAHARNYEICVLMLKVMRSMCSCPKLWDLCAEARRMYVGSFLLNVSCLSAIHVDVKFKNTTISLDSVSVVTRSHFLCFHYLPALTCLREVRKENINIFIAGHYSG